MAPPRKPLNVTVERIAELLDLDPTAEFGWRWRPRSLAEFGGNEPAGTTFMQADPPAARKSAAPLIRSSRSTARPMARNG